MIILLLATLVLLIFVGINKLLWRHEITLREMLINFGAISLFFAICWTISVAANLADTEILNGKVISKKIERVSCAHSYPCHCYTSCTGKSCTQFCSTCYDHLYDNRYTVETTIGDFWINRIDRQGLTVPPRFIEVREDDSVARRHTYNNYIKASNSSLFKDKVTLTKEEKKILPTYPLVIYDYYKIDRVIDQTGLYTKEEIVGANRTIAKSLNDLGKAKQVNFIVVLTKESEQYALKILSNWQGGKKNDVIVIIGLDDQKSITFVRVHSWSTEAIFNIRLGDNIKNLIILKDLEQAINVISTEIQATYHRRSFEEFAYLRGQSTPSDASLYIFIILSLAFSILLGYLFSRN